MAIIKIKYNCINNLKNNLVKSIKNPKQNLLKKKWW